MATVSKSMATKLSDLDDQKSLANIHTDGHTLTPPSGQNGPEEAEAFGSTYHVHHHSLQQGNHKLTAQRLGIPWRYR